VIDTLMATVEVGEGTLQLRLLPPLGSAARASLDGVLARLRSAARGQEKSAARALWRRFFLLRDAFASLGPAAVLTVHRSQGSTFGEVFVDADVFWPKDPLLRRQLVYVAVSRARTAVTLMAGTARPTDQQRWQDWLTDQDGEGVGTSNGEASG
jgi:exodeoxyribonuclease-5